MQIFIRNILQRQTQITIGLLLISLFFPGPFFGRAQAQEQTHDESEQIGAQLSTGFTRSTLVTGLNLPSDMERLPNGDILVTEKGSGAGPDGISHVRLVRDGVVQPTPVVQLSTDTEEDSGLLGLILDPDFANNHYFYLWYAAGETALDWPGEQVHRLSRFTLDVEQGIAVPGSETIMLDGVDWYDKHGGGGMVFDDQGNLYISIGDTNRRESVHDLGAWSGKVIRIRLTEDGYEIPDDNPFLEDESARPEIYALGIRSPFRMTRSPDGQIVLGDVGNTTWEEINLLAPGADYGWPEREGPCDMGRRGNCSPTPAHMTDPILAYVHPTEDDGGAVTALVFYEGDQFPAEYQGNLFYADFNSRAVWAVDLDESDPAPRQIASNLASIVDLEYWEDDLYYLDIVNGLIGRISYTGTDAEAGTDHEAPVAVLHTDHTFGVAPLTVNFSAAGSIAATNQDANNPIVAYRWNFDDGTPPLESTNPRVHHVYLDDGTYLARVAVVNEQGDVSEEIIRRIDVYSGETPELVLVNETDPERQTYRGGDVWRYGVERESGINGLGPNDPFRWGIDLLHNQHAHPILADHRVISDTFVIPRDNHGGDWNVGFRFRLTTRTETGQEFTLAREIFPEHVNLSVSSDLSPVAVPVTVEVNGTRYDDTYQWRAVVGTEHFLETPRVVNMDGGIEVFDHWEIIPEDGRAANSGDEEGQNALDTHNIAITVPVSNTTYVANYRYIGLYRQP